MSSNENATRLAALDMLRFIAAASVVLYHYISSYAYPIAEKSLLITATSAVTRYGYLGVNLFFMISGFVILMSAREKTALQFAIGRASRLYPSFWVAVLLSATLIVTFGSSIPGKSYPMVDASTILANFTMAPAVLGSPLIDTVYWTLELELRFYLLIFLLLLFGWARRAEAFCFFWLVVVAFGSWVDLPWLLKFLTLEPYGPFFLAGCFFFLLPTSSSPRRIWISLAICFVLCIKLTLLQRKEFINPDSASSVIAPAIIVAMFSAFAIQSIFSAAQRSAKIMTRFGSLTYPLYLTHAVPGSMLIFYLAPLIGPTLAVLIATTLAIVLAFFLAEFVDTPARRPFSHALTFALQKLPGTFFQHQLPTKGRNV